MSSSQEILRQAFPDKATPQVSSGITYIESCLKHVNETFKASKVYLIASGSLTRNTTFTSDLQKALGPKLAKTRVGMTPHTMMSEVLEVVEDARSVEADCIVTLGGGSLSDAAKLISFALANNVHNKSDLQRLPYIGKETVYPPAIASQIPIICIPTSLSGGEYSVYSGTTDDETHTKYQFCPPLKSPSLIILSGAVARTTPLDIWLQSGIRGVDHCVEALCSTISTEEVDKSATKGLQCLIPGLLKTKNDPNDEDTRHECQLGIMYAMLPLHRLIPCGASHGIGHMLGPLGKVGHGETSCILLPAVCKYNAKHGGEDIRARQKTVREILWAIPVAKERFEKRGLKEGEADLGDLIDVVVRELGLKRSLKEANVGRDMFLKLAEISKADPFMETNPVPIKGPSQVMEILELCAE